MGKPRRDRLSGSAAKAARDEVDRINVFLDKAEKKLKHRAWTTWTKQERTLVLQAKARRQHLLTQLYGKYEHDPFVNGT